MLLVEGYNDEKVVEHLLKNWGVSFENHFKIKQAGNIDELLKLIPRQIKESGIKTLGILADANNSFDNRQQSISDRLKEAHCSTTSQLAPIGTVFSGWKGIRIGIWLMPDNQTAGELENFIYRMIPKDDSILPNAKKFIDNIPVEDRKFSNKKLFRAYVHAWLATRKKPNPMGLAISAQDLDKNAKEAVQFYKWLRKLFEF
ncbi:MAG: hypothetical protein OXC62_06945 [Aestuariivita sp.]|nr:hypothetical protein [Aestuariivita sp.]